MKHLFGYTAGQDLACRSNDQMGICELVQSIASTFMYGFQNNFAQV